MHALQRLVIATFISCASLVPFAGYAESITLDGVSPAVDEDITPPDNQKAGEENFYTFWLKGQIGTEYTANFTVSEEPAFTFVSGGDMTLDSNVHFNAETNTFSVTYTAVALQQIDSQSGLELDENQTLTIIAVSFPVSDGENGPGEDTIGSWLATNFQEWTLTTPSSDNTAMGATVSGDPGDTGDFELFMPASAMALMAEYDDVDSYSVDDLAVYADGEKTSKTIESASSGAYINFSTTLPETDETSQSIQSSESVSRTFTVEPVPAITLRVSDSNVDKYDYVTLSGKIASGKKGKTVSLWRRNRNTSLTKFATVTTKRNGKFSLRVKIRKTVLFKAKFKGNVSDSVQVGLN